MKYTYVLRVCNADMTSSHGFTWPKSGFATCPDWSPEPVCGQGLHGWAAGEGDVSVATMIKPDSIWLVVRVETSKIVKLQGKVKFPRGLVVFTGSRDAAVAYVQKKHPNSACIYGTATAGDSGTATAGNSGTATAGYRGTATAGDWGIIVCRYHDGSRYRLVVGYIGEDGIEAGMKYRLNDEHKFIEVAK